MVDHKDDSSYVCTEGKLSGFLKFFPVQQDEPPKSWQLLHEEQWQEQEAANQPQTQLHFSEYQRKLLSLPIATRQRARQHSDEQLTGAHKDGHSTLDAEPAFDQPEVSPSSKRDEQQPSGGPGQHLSARPTSTGTLISDLVYIIFM